MLFGQLREYPSNAPLRPATVGERSASREAAESDANELGVFDRGDGTLAYVADAPEDL